MRLALFVIGLCTAAGCGSATPTPPIYLAHVATTTGTARAPGEQEAFGIRLAIEELARTAPDRLGGKPVFVKHADARGQLDVLEGQAVRLVTVGRAIALYGGNSAEEVLRLDRSRALVVTPLGYRPRGASDLVFHVGLAPSAQAHALARFAVEEKAVKSMVLFVDERRDDARALAEQFEREFDKALQEKYPKEERKKLETVRFAADAKFADLAEQTDLAKVQGLLFAGTASDYADWRKAFPAPKLAVVFAGDDGVLRDDGPNPAHVASAFAVDKDLPRTAEFAHKFREAFKEDPDVHAAVAYEGIRLLVDAMHRSFTPGGEPLPKEMRQTKDFAGLAGSLTMGADQQLRRPVFVGQRTGRALASPKRYETR